MKYMKKLDSPILSIIYNFTLKTHIDLHNFRNTSIYLWDYVQLTVYSEQQLVDATRLKKGQQDYQQNWRSWSYIIIYLKSKFQSLQEKRCKLRTLGVVFLFFSTMAWTKTRSPMDSDKSIVLKAGSWKVVEDKHKPTSSEQCRSCGFNSQIPIHECGQEELWSHINPCIYWLIV